MCRARLSQSPSLLGRRCSNVQVAESRSSGAIRSDGAAAEVENSDHVGNLCWSAVGQAAASTEHSLTSLAEVVQYGTGPLSPGLLCSDLTLNRR